MVRKGWATLAPHMPNNKQQLPEIDYAALASTPARKRGGLGAFIVLILLLAGVLFFFRNHLFRNAHLFTSEPATVTQNTSNIENPRPPVPQSTLKPKPKKLAEIELPSTANSETNERVTRPIISVEVIFPGGQRRTIHPHNGSVNLDLGSSTTPTSAQTQPPAAAPIAVNAAEPEQVLADSPEVLYRPSEPIYPRLAEQMKIEGSVTLQVNIDKVGNIVSTQVLSGPEVLATAAQEAIRHWRFRPHYKNGAPIETEAHVVVNFTISTR
jgi:TonB family protein